MTWEGPKPISRVVEGLSRLPGIGPKTAQRLTYYLLRASREQVGELADALRDLKDNVKLCSTCFNISDQDPCHICTNPRRDQSTICVVEEPLDLVAIERTARFGGVYHVLHGAISPMDGIGPDELRIRPLISRLGPGTKVQEVILATNPNLEGDATAMYITKLVEPLGIKITRLARGLPIGGDLEYADEITLGNAFAGRS
ncbi:MAG TPA: recombination mediator RecR [Chloroflexota bacterium]|nr:recombination mediator RecR [Chloroflexota bacterium]